jgi:hypothetical protein
MRLGQMNQTSCRDDGDNAWPQRHPVVDQDDVGALACREHAAIL